MRNVLVCCVILTITISASCLPRTIQPQQKGKMCIRRLIKRDAPLIVDTSPIDTDPVYKVHPVIAFRRLSKSRQTPRSIQAPKLYKSTKKYRKPRKPKHSPASTYRQRVKSNQLKHYINRVVGNSKNYPEYLPYYAKQNGFGEPPLDLKSYDKNEYETRPKPNNRDELVDSYGEPIIPRNIDSFPTKHPSKFIERPRVSPAHQSWQDYYSKQRPNHKKPESIDNEDIDEDEDSKMDNAYYYYWMQDKPTINKEQNKLVRIPWRVKGKRKRENDDILVGGQYAEPPARYVPKFQPSAPMIDDGDDFTPPSRDIESVITTSATISPYVNYKHSNMAFSPQNLNDVFSIVAK